MRKLSHTKKLLRPFKNFVVHTYGKGLKNDLNSHLADHPEKQINNFLRLWIDFQPGIVIFFDVGVEFRSKKDQVSLYWNKATSKELARQAGVNIGSPKVYLRLG
jgi:hypothetical protein